MKTIKASDLQPQDLVGAIATAKQGEQLTIWYVGDQVPQTPQQEDPEAPLRAAYEAEQQAAKEAEFARYKARAGQPSYKAAAVKIAAEKLGVLDIINTTIVALISTAQDKSLLVWWDEIDTISRADAQWQEIETALPKNIDVTELFTLVTQITISALPSSTPTTINLLFSEQPQTTINPAAPTMWQKTKQLFGF